MFLIERALDELRCESQLLLDARDAEQMTAGEARLAQIHRPEETKSWKQWQQTTSSKRRPRSLVQQVNWGQGFDAHPGTLEGLQ